MGVGLIDEADVIQEIEQDLGYAVPVGGVNIDPVWFGHEKDFEQLLVQKNMGILLGSCEVKYFR